MRLGGYFVFAALVSVDAFHGGVASATPAESVAAPATGVTYRCSDDPDVTRLNTALEAFASEGRDMRSAMGLTALGSAAVLLPAGLVLVGRSDAVAQSLGLSMSISGSVALLSVPFTLIPSTMEQLRDDFRAALAAGNVTAAATIANTEAAWALAARKSAKRRHLSGAVASLVGAASVALGFVLLLAPTGIAGMDQTTQYAWGASLVGAGVPLSTSGARALLVENPEESSWRVYQGMKSDMSPPRIERSTTALYLTIAPTVGGGIAVGSLAF